MSAPVAVVKTTEVSYKILKWIGGGGVCQVFKVLRNNKIMACKQIRTDDPDFEPAEHQHMMMVKEGPHIAAVHDDVEWNPRLRTLSFFMDYYRGKDLERLIHMMRASEARFTETQVIELAYRISVALEHCHSLEILHQGMKPMNVLLGEPWNPIDDPVIPNLYVTDSAIASNVEMIGTTISGQRGTPEYEAPEIRGQVPYSFSQKSDIYAFGCILFRLCTLDGPDHAAGLKPFEISQDYSVDLLSLISSMLSDDRMDRPTAADVRAHLIMLIRRNISPNAQECEQCGNVFLSNNQLRKHMKAAHHHLTGSNDLRGDNGLAEVSPNNPTPQIWIEENFEFDSEPMLGPALEDGPTREAAEPTPCVVCMRNFNSKKRFFQHLHCQRHWRDGYYVLKRRSENEININNSKRKRF